MASNGPSRFKKNVVWSKNKFICCLLINKKKHNNTWNILPMLTFLDDVIKRMTDTDKEHGIESGTEKI